MRKLLSLNLYRIFIDGGYRNKVFATQDQINHYNFQVENVVEEILKRKTGQIIRNLEPLPPHLIGVGPLRTD
jgi:hypothetical protein